MKKVFLILTLVIGMFSCTNFDKDFSDFTYTSGFFPYQYPVRTLVLGDYIYDNSNDNAHKFVISVAMGGVYENTKDRVFDIEVDESLCTNATFGNGDPIKALPANYYTLSSTSQITIPKGKMNGGIEVQLTDAFFNDPEAIKNTFVVPIRLKASSDVDTILSGSTPKTNADPRVAAHWDVLPKNFTMFAVKFINELHGVYFHYGKNQVFDNTNVAVKDSVYSATYVEKNSTSKLVTSGRYQVSLTTSLRSKLITGNVNMLLDFNGNNCTVSAAPGETKTISGTGEIKAKAYSWGDKERDGIVLKYTVSDGTYRYEAEETLVIRDRAVKMETYVPTVNN